MIRLALHVLRLCIFCCALFSSFSLVAQITSSTLKGMIQDQTGEPLIGATVVATHLPTGTIYGTTTQDDGGYILLYLKSGGPYELRSNYLGYEEQVETQVVLELGKTRIQHFTLKETATMLEGVEVVYDKNDPFQSRQKGTSTNVDADAIAALPTLNRSLQDVTRLSPNGNASAFAGTNYRFNNLSIDGASNNDVLGFQEPASGAGGSVASGTPGSLAQTQPISLDAVQEVQVAIAPFDVRFGNFTGANLNVVTKNGTNQWKGSVYGYGRNQLLTGKSIDETRTPIEDFYDAQAGLSIGGPIIKNKLFFFANYELGRRSQPVLGVPGTPGSNVPLDITEQVAETLQQRYGYDPGSFEQTNIQRQNDKFFFRLDYNLGPKHQLTLRHNIVKAFADNLERGERILKYETQGFRHHSTTNSSVLELKSQLSNTAANHLIIGHNIVEDGRTYDGRIFPHVEIKYNTANTIFFGPYREASIYGLTLHTTQFTNNLTFYRKKHQLTIGTSNELYNLEYRFLTAWNGRWEYKTVDDFFNDRPSRIRGVYNYGDNSFDFNKNNPSADFRILLPSVYIQDEYQWSEQLSFSLGLRMDMQYNLDEFPLSPDLQNTPELAGYTNKINTKPKINPRFGFNYNLQTNRKSQLRGGVGFFSGRIPFAWYAYPHYISGINYGNIDIKPGGEVVPIAENLADLQDRQPGLTEINLVDNDFVLPRQIRGSLAYDVELPWKTFVTVEGVYSKTLQGIQFQTLNLKNETENYLGADDRSFYSAADRKLNPNFTNVFLLTNTDKGYQYQVSLSARKEVRSNLQVFGAYTYGESKDLVNGVRNSMAANFNVNQAVNSNNPDLAFSNFDLRHRIVASANWSIDWSEKHKTYLSGIFNGQSGSPFSYIISGDLDKDGSSRNDLIYVPRDASEIQFEDIVDGNGQLLVSASQQWTQFETFISEDEHLNEQRGSYAERNVGRTPWNRQLDLRIAHQWQLPNEQQVEITLDIFNFFNLLNHEWGWQHFVPNVSNSSFALLDLVGTSEGRPVYQFKNPGTPWQVDPLNSRWQAQLGLRYSF